MFSNEERGDMLKVYYVCQRNSQRASEMYFNEYPERRQPSVNIFQKLHRNIRDYGSFRKPRRKYGTRTTEEETEVVLNQIRNNPSVSTRQIKEQINQPAINHMKAWRILKRNNYKAYKLHTSQNLLPGDSQRRLQYCQWMQEKIRENNDFPQMVIWSDESKFTNCGMFNRTTEHVWATENPRANREIRNQVRFSVNVWAGLYKGRIFGPFFYEGNLSGEAYLHFLQTHFQEYLMEIPLAELRTLWFQQDGAPPHNVRAVRNFLNEEFPGKWIANSGYVEWPARSPDLSPMDYFFWGAIKNTPNKHVGGT